jgi:hypothetical protein
MACDGTLNSTITQGCCEDYRNNSHSISIHKPHATGVMPDAQCAFGNSEDQLVVHILSLNMKQNYAIVIYSRTTVFFELISSPEMYGLHDPIYICPTVHPESQTVGCDVQYERDLFSVELVVGSG